MVNTTKGSSANTAASGLRFRPIPYFFPIADFSMQLRPHFKFHSAEMIKSGADRQLAQRRYLPKSPKESDEV